jgi:hypothetical protein
MFSPFCTLKIKHNYKFSSKSFVKFLMLLSSVNVCTFDEFEISLINFDQTDINLPYKLKKNQISYWPHFAL